MNVSFQNHVLCFLSFSRKALHKAMLGFRGAWDWLPRGRQVTDPSGFAQGLWLKENEQLGFTGIEIEEDKDWYSCWTPLLDLWRCVHRKVVGEANPGLLMTPGRVSSSGSLGRPLLQYRQKLYVEPLSHFLGSGEKRHEQSEVSSVDHVRTLMRHPKAS
jgi:hypothetical protein